MPPTKRKAQVRRQVLDLKGEDAYSRSTWQTKYQNIQMGNGIDQNGEPLPKTEETGSPTSSAMKTNPLMGLVGSYNSDSDGDDTTDVPKKSLDSKVQDFLKEIESVSYEPRTVVENSVRDTQSSSGTYYHAQLSKWQQCYDHNSGYPYYWNTETNEVTWEMPLEFKTAVENAAMQRHQSDPYSQIQMFETSSEKMKNPKPKSVCKYPWQDSDSEDEKIEMITSFGPQSGEEESQEGLDSRKSKAPCDKPKNSAKDSVVGPQLPAVPLVQYGSKRLSDIDDAEAESLNDSSYETSSLLTYRVQDTGPPGDDSFNNNNETLVEKESNLKINAFNSSCSEVPDDCAKKELEYDVDEKQLKTDKKSGSCDNCDNISDKPCVSQTVEESDSVKPNVAKQRDGDTGFDFADNVIAEIEKEMPPDYGAGLAKKSEEVTGSENKVLPPEDNSHKSSSNTKSSGISGFALLANYEDDSESEEGSVCEKRKPRDSPIIDAPPAKEPEEKTRKPLFPCMEVDVEKQGKESLPSEKPSAGKPDTRAEGETGNIYDPEPDSSIMHKAFKRKKRIEFATTAYGPTVAEIKSFSPDHAAVTSQYNIDPSRNDHRGFGFSSSTDPSKKSSKMHGGWVQFVKSETILPTQNEDHKQKAEIRTEGKCESDADDCVTEEEIDDNASLLKEKVTFLTEGRGEISPIQYIAIQLETLWIAWQQRALSKKYFCNWVKEKCSDLIRHEKSAAPPGWTCLWDRKSKRYFYRNVATKVVQWEYPTEDSSAVASTGLKAAKEPETEGSGEEMELCFTPPHQSSPDEVKGLIGERPTTPPSAISDSSEALPSAPNVPRASSDTDGTTVGSSVQSKKKKRDVVDEEETCTAAPLTTEPEKRETAPPLPPMPPPPDEPPPPLPNSPPPLPLDPDQPLPPGVDEPEYGMFRRSSPKQPYKKSQAEAPSYPSDVIVGYGYAIQASANPIAIQPVDYRGYVRDSLTGNPYVVQSAPTSHVIHCPAKKSKLSLSSELDSFYSDIAMLDTGAPESSAEKVPVEKAVSPEPTTVVSQPSANQTIQTKASPGNASTPTSVVKQTESPSFNGAAAKKKKKSKLTPALSMKKKGVSSLVAKWQQVQQEVRWDLISDDDEDDDGSSSHK